MLLHFLQILFKCPFLTEASGLSHLSICPSSIFCLSPPCPVPGESDHHGPHCLRFLALRLLGGFGPREALPGDEGQKERDVAVFFPCVAPALLWTVGPVPPGPQLQLGGVVLHSPAPPNPRLPMTPFPPFALQSQSCNPFCCLWCLKTPVGSLIFVHSSRPFTKT